MSLYFITEPREIPFETIKAAVLKADDMGIILNNSGNPTISMPDYVNPTENLVNWLHLEVDVETQTMTNCFQKGTSDCSGILEYLEIALGCRFISQDDPEYYRFEDWSDGEKDE